MPKKTPEPLRKTLDRLVPAMFRRQQKELVDFTADDIEQFVQKIAPRYVRYLDAQYVDSLLELHTSLLLEREGYLRSCISPHDTRMLDAKGDVADVYEILPPLQKLIDAYNARPQS